jgi:transposase InsO family protein
MLTYANDAKTTALLMFNHIIVRFNVPQSLVTDHGSHFSNTMMTKLATLLHFDQEHSSPYYPQANG